MQDSKMMCMQNDVHCIQTDVFCVQTDTDKMIVYMSHYSQHKYKCTNVSHYNSCSSWIPTLNLTLTLTRTITLTLTLNPDTNPNLNHLRFHPTKPGRLAIGTANGEVVVLNLEGSSLNSIFNSNPDPNP